MVSKLEDLKVTPAEAVKILGDRFTSGYQLKDGLWREYRQDRAKGAMSDNEMEKYNKRVTAWLNEALIELQNVFATPRQAYLFRDAPTSGLAYIGENAHFSDLIVKHEARLNQLNKLIEFLYDHADIKVVAQRDAYVQSGDGNIQEVKNEY